METGTSNTIAERVRDQLSISIIRKMWRDKVAFWILGFCNRLGFIVILCAAQDILHSHLPDLEFVEPPRHCHALSTGVVLLFNVVPAHLMQFLSPNSLKCLDTLVTISFLVCFIGYLMFAFSNMLYMSLLCVTLISFAYGLGDYALSIYCRLYKPIVISKWRDGTAAVGCFATISYAGLRECKISLSIIWFCLLIFPVVAAIAFWLLLQQPPPPMVSDDSEFSLSIFQQNSEQLQFFEDKCAYIMHLNQYIIPLSSIIIFQNFINQGLYEFIYFRANLISTASQFRWFHAIFQTGYYACVTTKNIVQTNHIWIWTILEFLIGVLLLLDATFFFVPYLWTIMLVVYLQGILSGAAYQNTVDKMFHQESISHLDFAKTVLKQSITLSTILGGSLAIGVHYILCKSLEPPRP